MGAVSEISGVTLHAYSPVVYFTHAIRSAQRNADGTVQSIEPRKVLVAQNGGLTRAAYWDGASSGHSDPTVATDSSGNVLTAGIPLGGPMAWSGDRLWVAFRNRLYAGDISDPLSFTENEYAGEGGFFSFEDDIVALAEIPALQKPLLLVFTKTNTYAVQSWIRDRSSWKSTANFKFTLFPGIGCVSHRAVSSQQGLLWWVSPQVGLTNFNAAQQSTVTSRLVPQDAEMAISKARTWSNQDGVAAGTFENFLLISVPYASKYNTHTRVLDLTPLPGVGEEPKPSWAGVWTGIRPVEWVSGPINGVPRLFCVSVDRDGHNRLWEAFRPERTDNGHPIACLLETKSHMDFSKEATGLDLKKIQFSEVTFSKVRGVVAGSVSWAGLRGKYHPFGSFLLNATRGSVTSNQPVNEVSTYLSQSRRVRTPNVSLSGDCSTCGVESSRGDWLDVGFSLLIRWQGEASLQSYRIFADPEQEAGAGEAFPNESGVRILDGSECT